ncbi:MAG: S8 family serine peptidase, partial [Natronosporangium sp.]
VRGEEVILASIDTGVQFDHPALVEQYRGNLGDGTFDHNYHWFDPAGTCPDAPCDQNGHGTHTMGTMAGDDGGDNQIGVAPRATWITANGCCPDNDALVASGQWMLAPEDLQGDNADPARRPHIVNNSWGTRVPSNDPIMEDVLLAWEASGILGIWSNGNSGSFGCASSGSPGSRVLNYSVGAYDIDNQIASFSGRGPGQDGEIKPNIAAPGVAVRSALPTDGYGPLDGTSMAAPHVSGAAALLLSAAPGLIGDLPAVKALLDGTARDTEDLQCGGTAEDNNVYGEGRLDALALLAAAPVGAAGTLAGQVTDAGTGDPVARASVNVVGEGVDRDLVTGLDGGYRTRLPAGSYTVTVDAFGYQPQTATGVVVTAGATTVRDIDLPPLPSVSLTGRVTDGSGHGWPVYARVTVDGTPVSTWTDPFTGRYAVRLPADDSYPVTVQPAYPGYDPVTDPVELGSVDVVHDVAVTVPETGCEAAPGYQPGDGGCVPVPGGLVAGLVTDGNTGDAVDGATVASDVDPAARATTVATPDDPALADGFYWLFTSAPADQLTVTAYRYPARTAAVPVPPDTT